MKKKDFNLSKVNLRVCSHTVSREIMYQMQNNKSFKI